ncbi:MAG TPA: transporter substrate-binding domain-containing protein [Aestuariivirgaceae bacterium]|jgi:polar amino acid transport system substrate-binding protein|nr:transporter substrate-binding domain-containing protein [Aestuariivirgaceae bacterium]
MSMKFSRRGLGALSSVVAAGFFVSPADAKSLDDIVKDGVLRIGINPNSPPFSQRSASGDFEGFDVAIGSKIAEELKLKPEWVPTETAQRVPFLVADTIDISLGGLTRNSERAKVIEYTVPLHTEVMGVLTTDKNPVAKWQELNDEKYTLVDVRSAWTIDWAKQNLPKAKMEIVDSSADAVRAIAQGRANALVEMLDFFTAFTKNHSDVKWVVLNDKIDVGWDCIGVQKGNYALRDVLNITLYKLQSSGFVDDEWRKAFGSDPLMKVPAQPYF